MAASVTGKRSDTDGHSPHPRRLDAERPHGDGEIVDGPSLCVDYLLAKTAQRDVAAKEAEAEKARAVAGAREAEQRSHQN